MKKSIKEKFQLVEFLQLFLPTLDSKIPTKINEGGCGIFAYHFHNTLTSMGFEPTLRFIGEKKSENDLKELVGNNHLNNKRVGILHCNVLLSDSLCFDSMGLKTPIRLISEAGKCEKIITGEISVEALKLLNDNIGSWNVVFDRSCEKNIIDELSQLPIEFENFKKGTYEPKVSKGIRYTDYTINKMRGGNLMNSLLSGLGGKPKGKDKSIEGFLSMLNMNNINTSKNDKPMGFKEYREKRMSGMSMENIMKEDIKRILEKKD